MHLVRRPEVFAPIYPHAGDTAVTPVRGQDFPENPLLEGSSEVTQITLGKPKEAPTFGWDCEYGEKVCDIWPFKASQMLVSNGEFFEFVSEGGYHERKFWTDEVFHSFFSLVLPLVLLVVSHVRSFFIL